MSREMKSIEGEGRGEGDGEEREATVPKNISYKIGFVIMSFESYHHLNI